MGRAANATIQRIAIASLLADKYEAPDTKTIKWLHFCYILLLLKASIICINRTYNNKAFHMAVPLPGAAESHIPVED